MEMNEFNDTAIRTEGGHVYFDLRPFGNRQGEAMDSYLHEAVMSIQMGVSSFGQRQIVLLTDASMIIPDSARTHGRVVLLVNEHTASAGEMVSAFAEENNLATIVGVKTPGRLLSGSAYKVGHGYILGLPVAAYLTWQGRMLENNGIVPKFSIGLLREVLKEGNDDQLETAVQVAKAI
jgi:C-terminal processing protease CtpA/Prc